MGGGGLEGYSKSAKNYTLVIPTVFFLTKKIKRFPLTCHGFLKGISISRALSLLGLPSSGYSTSMSPRATNASISGGDTFEVFLHIGTTTKNQKIKIAKKKN